MHSSEVGNERLRVGFVGVGAIAAAMVEAVLTGPHADELEVVLSPRSHRRSAELAARFPQVRVAGDNRSVVDGSDIVLLAVLPDQLPDVCAEVTFRADQDVASLVAGWPPARLSPLVEPATAVSQLIPLPMIALHTGPVVLCPPSPRIEYLLEGCGELVTLEHEHDIVALSCASATMSSFLAFENTTIDWLIARGLPERQARDYVAALYLGLATETRQADLATRPEMPQEHETPGGLNHYLRTSLTEAEMFAALTEHLDRLHGRWSRRSD